MFFIYNDTDDADIFVMPLKETPFLRSRKEESESESESERDGVWIFGFGDNG